jgi:insertion element IS1 protein InsB
MVIRDVCPRCQSPKLKQNGHMHNGTQNHHCHDGGRQCVQCCEPSLISADQRDRIERLLVERSSLRGSCRAVGVTRKGLLGFLVPCVAALPAHLHGQPIAWQHDVLSQRLAVEAEALASVGPKQAKKPWVGLAMAAKTRPSLALHVGARSHQSAEHLWAKMPHASRPHATCYTAQYVG